MYVFFCRFPGHSCDDIRWFRFSHDLSETIRLQCDRFQFILGRIGHSVGHHCSWHFRTGRWQDQVCDIINYLIAPCSRKKSVNNASIKIIFKYN